MSYFDDNEEAIVFGFYRSSGRGSAARCRRCGRRGLRYIAGQLCEQDYTKHVCKDEDLHAQTLKSFEDLS